MLAESTSDDNIVEIATLISSVLSYLKDNYQYDIFNELASRLKNAVRQYSISALFGRCKFLLMSGYKVDEV